MIWILTKEMMKLAGNGMSMRCLFAVLIAGLMALNQGKTRRYLVTSKKK